MQGIINKLFQGWHLFHNYSKAYNGRIWMLWKGDMEVKLVDDTNQCITCKVCMESQNFFLSAIYGRYDGIERRSLWDHLITLHSFIYEDPWILAGEFNIIT